MFAVLPTTSAATSAQQQSNSPKCVVPTTSCRKTQVTTWQTAICNFAKNRNYNAIVGPLKAIDLETLGLLVGLFLMIGGISHMGVIKALAQLLAQLGDWGYVQAELDDMPPVRAFLPMSAIL
jgi:hypothetical protein